MLDSVFPLVGSQCGVNYYNHRVRYSSLTVVDRIRCQGWISLFLQEKSLPRLSWSLAAWCHLFVPNAGSALTGWGWNSLETTSNSLLSMICGAALNPFNHSIIYPQNRLWIINTSSPMCKSKLIQIHLKCCIFLNLSAWANIFSKWQH